jgi:multidrug efflux pump subunit AcrB
VFVNEGELFGGIGGSARSVALHLQSTDTTALNAAAEEGRKLLERTFPGANVQFVPEPQTCKRWSCAQSRTIAHRRSRLGPRIARHVVRALGDGAWLGEYFDGQTRLPVILRRTSARRPKSWSAPPLITPSGETVSLGELVNLQTAVAPDQIRRIDHHRT